MITSLSPLFSAVPVSLKSKESRQCFKTTRYIPMLGFYTTPLWMLECKTLKEKSFMPWMVGSTGSMENRSEGNWIPFKGWRFLLFVWLEWKRKKKKENWRKSVWHCLTTSLSIWGELLQLSEGKPFPSLYSPLLRWSEKVISQGWVHPPVFFPFPWIYLRTKERKVTLSRPFMPSKPNSLPSFIHRLLNSP